MSVGEPDLEKPISGLCIPELTDLRVSVFFLAEFSNSISALAGNVNKLPYLENLKKRDFLSSNINAGLI